MARIQNPSLPVITQLTLVFFLVLSLSRQSRSPIYAVTSWFSLVFHSAEGYLAIIKDGYEAYIIYQFLSFCISVIGRGDRDVVVDVLARHAQSLTPPFRLFGCFEICGCCKPKPFPNDRALADAILLQCQGFALQFVLFRPLTTTAMVVLKHFEPSSNGYDPTDYGNGDGPTDYDNGDGPTVHLPPQFYITIVQNLSIFVAFTGLLKFYHAVDEELQWCRPLAKFLYVILTPESLKAINCFSRLTLCPLQVYQRRSVHDILARVVYKYSGANNKCGGG